MILVALVALSVFALSTMFLLPMVISCVSLLVVYLLIKGVSKCTECVHECCEWVLDRDDFGECCCCFSVCDCLETAFRAGLFWPLKLLFAVFWKGNQQFPSAIHAVVRFYSDYDDEVSVPPMPLAFLKALVFCFPQALNEQDYDGDTPLHALLRYAISSSRKYDAHVIAGAKYLIEKGPEALATTNDEGYLPLHLIVELRKRWCSGKRYNERWLELFWIVIRAFEGAAQVPCEEGSLPLHMALMNNEKEEVVLELMRCYPNAVCVRMGHELPHEYMRSRNTSITSFLESMFDSLVRDELATFSNHFQLEGGPELLIASFMGISPAFVGLSPATEV